MYVENIVINTPLVSPESMFSSSHEDWITNEEPKTFYTTEVFLPKVLARAGIVKSSNEVRRNRPDLIKILYQYDYLEIKYGKRKLFILVGI